MASPVTGHLPSPHDHITISVERWFRNAWHVDYTGTPKQLMAAGIVDDDTARKIVSRKGGARIGKDGLPTSIRAPFGGRIAADHILWAGDEPVVARRKCRNGDHLMQLPGVRELFPNGVPTDEQDDELTHEQIGALFPTITLRMAYMASVVAERIGASSVRNASLRDRRVGRRQRPAQWLSMGKVIAPYFSAGGAA